MSDFKKKIAILGVKTYPAYFGADRVVENMMEYVDQKYEYFIYLQNTSDKVRSMHNNMHFIYLPSLPGKHLNAFSFYVLCTAHLLFGKKFDLIHAHKSDLGLFTSILKLRYGRKILGTFHGNPYESSKWGKIAKTYLRVSEKLFVRSCYKLTSVSDLKKSDRKNIQYIPNGIERIPVGKFQNYKNKSFNYEALGVKKGRYILFASGRVYRSKGLHLLLDAYRDGDLNTQLVIIGDFLHDKEYDEEIDQQINALSTKNIIVIKKLVPKQDLFDIIIHSKMVVFPTENEAMSMFLLEVLACRKIIVSSDIEANVNILGKGYKYFFQSKNAGSLSSVIRMALTDIEGQAKNNAPVPNTLFRNYRWKFIVENYMRLYQSFF